ncbi:hypothetical protein [Pluralibacter gergoviae]|uniref:hypothetical protein n=1 Tax=Pluralibacter gergoviae TaxID=61647 RepID=UPI00389B16E3
MDSKPTYEDLQQQTAALDAINRQLNEKVMVLAAEGAAMKDINAWCKTDAFKNMYREFKTAEALGCPAVDCMHDALLVAIMHAPKTPDTDAAIANFRAQGVDGFVDNCRGKAESAIAGDIRDNWNLLADHAEYFAQQLRAEASK